MLKVQLDSIRVTVRMAWESSGSVMAGTIESRCTRAESELQIGSSSDPALVAALIRNAKGGCYVESTLRDPVELRSIATLNGEQLDLAAYPKRPPRH